MSKARNASFKYESELQEAEKAILLIDQRFQYSAKATNDAIYDLNFDTNQIYWSDTYETIFGFSIDEQESELSTWSSRIYADDRENVCTSLDEAIAKRKAFWQEEYRYLCADGSFKYVCDRGYLFYDVDGTPRRMIGAMQDITERKQSEEELNLKNAYLQELFDASPLGIVMLDAHDRIIKANAGFTHIFQYTSGEVTGRFLNDVLATPELQEEATAISLSCLNKIPTQVESKRRRKDGELIDVQIIGYPIVVNNKLKGIYGIYADISDRKRNEESIRKSEKQFRTLVNTMNEGLMQIDKDANVVYVNRQFCEMAGYTQEELLGKNCIELLFDDESLIDIQNKMQERRAGLSDRYESTLLKKTGEKIWVLVSSAPVTDEQGNVIGSLGTFTDITNQKEQELTLIRKNAELQKTNSELDRFVYSASHELRAPLTSILGLLNLAEINMDIEETSEYIKLIRKSVQRLDFFIQDIVHYSRNARLDVEYEPVNLKKLANETIHNLKFMEGAEKITYHVEVDELTGFMSDIKSIGVILNNLISNAIKYHNHETEFPHIRVRAKMLHDMAEIIVEDNGQGIAEKYRDKIFDMFFRAAENAKGSGLGLYIVKEIVEKLGGYINVESSIGQGTAFCIKLPQKQL